MTMHKIADRIRKLLKLAGNNPSPEEAATAFARAQELATKYALSLDDVDVEEEERAPPTSEDMETLRVEKWKKYVRWKGVIGMAVAKANLCDCYRGRDGLYFFGEPRQLEIAAYMFKAIVAQVDVLAREAVRCRDTRISGRRFGTAFRAGVSDTVHTRLTESAERALDKAEAEARAIGGAALVRVDKARAFHDATRTALARKAAEIGLSTTRSRRCVNANAYRAGRFAGQSIRLSAGGAAALKGGS